MRTIVGNELTYSKGGKGFQEITFSGLNGQVVGFLGNEKHGINHILPILGSHLVPTSGRVLYDGYEFNQKGGEVKMPLELYSDGRIFPSVSFVERIFSSAKFTLSRAQLINKYFTEVTAVSMKKLHKMPNSKEQKLNNFCAYLSFSHGVFLLENPFKEFSEDDKQKGLNLLRELADRFKEIYVVTHDNLEDLKICCDSIIDLDSSTEVYTKVDEESESVETE